MLKSHGHEVVPVGIRTGRGGRHGHSYRPAPGHRRGHGDPVRGPAKPARAWYDYILDLKPKRILFNPGTENPELERLAQQRGIQTEEACTLVLLSIGQLLGRSVGAE